MSVEFTLRHNGLDQAAWTELYTSWAQDCAEELYEQSGFDDEDSDYCYVAGEGSTRGFRIQLADGEVQFRLDALASTSDWHRCFSLCRRAIEQGGGELEREDGEVYPLGDLSDGRAAEEARADFVATLEACTRMMEQQQQQQMQLPTGLFMIPVGKPDLAGRPEEVMARIAARFEAYATAHRPSLGFQHQEYGQGCIVTAWGCHFPKLGAVAVPTHAEQFDSETVILPWDRFEGLFGEHLHDLGNDTFYLPPFAELPDAVLAKIPEQAVVLEPAGATSSSSDRAEAGPEAERADGNREHEAAVLVMAPLVAVLVVAGSDGSIDRKELQAAVGYMQRYMGTGSSDTVKALFAACIENAQAILAKAQEGGAPLLVLAQVGDAITRTLDPTEAAAYRRALIELATAVASASGGILGLFGSKISKGERAAIAMLEAMLSPDRD